MTKPINEPTPALEAANYGWRIRQLERRPELSNEIPYADMYWFFSGGTPVDDAVSYNFTDIGPGPATAAFTTDTTVFQIDIGNGIITWDDDTQHGAPALARAQIVWSAGTAFGPRQVTINYSAAYHLFFEGSNSQELTLANPGGVASEHQEVDTFFFLGHESESTTGGISGALYHEMAGPQDVVWASLSIIRLSPTQAFDDVDPGGTYFP